MSCAVCSLPYNSTTRKSVYAKCGHPISLICYWDNKCTECGEHELDVSGIEPIDQPEGTLRKRVLTPKSKSSLYPSPANKRLHFTFYLF